jgi:hypothetical protein
MSTAVSKFQTAFVGAEQTSRAQIIQAAVKSNSKDEKIVNLLSQINLEDVSVRNNMKQGSIYYVCSILRTLPKFVYV